MGLSLVWTLECWKEELTTAPLVPEPSDVTAMVTIAFSPDVHTWDNVMKCLRQLC